MSNVPICEIKERKFNPFFLWGFENKKHWMLFLMPSPIIQIIDTKKHVNVTFDAQVVFIRDDEVQRILAYKLGHQI